MNLSKDISDDRKDSRNVAVLLSKTLDLPPSCLEFAPRNKNGTAEHFIVGTYHLQHEHELGQHDSNESHEQSRMGSLILFRLHGGSLDLLETVPYPSAILDLHFYHDENIFAVASSTGVISIFRLVEENEDYMIKQLASHQVAPKNILVLSFAWYPIVNIHDAIQYPIAFFTLSNGQVLAIRFSSDFESFSALNGGTPLIVHEDNAWTCAVTRSTLFSGSDDSILSRLDLDHELIDSRDENIVEASKKDLVNGPLAQTNYKGHNAGVIAILILPTPSSENLANFILTGSYDDYVRVFFVKPNNFGMRPNNISTQAELKIGNGVWRLKMMGARALKLRDKNDEWEYMVLASCMRGGALILKVTGSYNGDWHIEILAEMRAHQSMCYASDVQPQSSFSKGCESYKDEFPDQMSPPRVWTVVSSSFYDKLLVVWEYTYLTSNQK
ncbi:Diphthine methyltransferase [Golovinomyces cichoracearum]|uniref:methylated diphthine methylhydrolase n=1 Tax=Golovinomyces cichoracearum TaxID=62708 RepID=A0A420J885_9PEZI|nr:Diphthine methyltransferase [Golovinomyces cichoracearum]